MREVPRRRTSCSDALEFYRASLRTPRASLRTPRASLRTPRASLRTPRASLRTPRAALFLFSELRCRGGRCERFHDVEPLAATLFSMLRERLFEHRELLCASRGRRCERFHDVEPLAATLFECRERLFEHRERVLEHRERLSECRASRHAEADGRTPVGRPFCRHRANPEAARRPRYGPVERGAAKGSSWVSSEVLGRWDAGTRRASTRTSYPERAAREGTSIHRLTPSLAATWARAPRSRPRGVAVPPSWRPSTRQRKPSSGWGRDRTTKARKLSPPRLRSLLRPSPFREREGRGG